MQGKRLRRTVLPPGRTEGPQQLAVGRGQRRLVEQVRAPQPGPAQRLHPPPAGDFGVVAGQQHFRNGPELVLDRPERFDLVLTDQVMPDVSGIDLAARIHAVRPDLPVVLCTGGNQHDEHRARRAGIRAILLKPITSRDLAALLDRLLKPAG